MTKYDKVIKKYGSMTQILQTMEECGELVVVLNHYLRGRADVKAVMKELVDVQIMIDQMKELFDLMDATMFSTSYNKRVRELMEECDD